MGRKANTARFIRRQATKAANKRHDATVSRETREAGGRLAGSTGHERHIARHSRREGRPREMTDGERVRATGGGAGMILAVVGVGALFAALWIGGWLWGEYAGAI